MKFELTEEQIFQYKEWRKTKEVYCGAAGGCYTFNFTPTGIGEIVTVECSDGTKINLTDYDMM